MKDFIKKYLGYILCAIVLVLAWLLFGQERAEKERYKANQTALLSDVAYYKTENERNVASVRALTLTKSEIEMYNKNLAERCEELEISLRRLISANITNMQTDYHLVGELRDSLVLRYNTIDTLRCMDYDDSYLTFSACVDSAGMYVADIVSRDTVTAIVHRISRRFLFFKFGTKEVRQEVHCANPRTQIITTQYVEKK
ncbi:MAG: hypothetical protein J5554_00645 [Paludibacteraceae bacterium]|nr:hypothetical protein [Paludibacteraceae bacterium]